MATTTRRRGDTTRRFLRSVVAAALLVTFASAASAGGAREPSPVALGSKPPPDPAVCGYLYEWLNVWEFPLQPDPHAAYTYVIPRVTSEPIGFVISGPFPYAAWTSWTVYDGTVRPFSLAGDSAITPDPGSVNPFIAGTPVLSPNRSFTLLLLPQGTDPGAIAAPLRSIPASNIINSPTSGDFYLIAYRVYDAFPGYNRGGAGGPTNTPFPQVKAINYQTGGDVDCSQENLLPSPKPPTDLPTNPTSVPSTGAITLINGTTIPLGPQGSTRSAEGIPQALAGAQYAPALDPNRIEFTRPPLVAGADVPSIPPPDNCSGYLGAATSTTKIGLIRLPHVAQWFDTSNLTPSTPFAQNETSYISFTMYGSSLHRYEPGSPTTGSLGNAELKVDASGGTTILVWPRSLSRQDQERVFDYVDRNGWAIMRGGEEGPVTTANLIVRLKGASPSYAGGYTPTAERQGVPCYFDDNPSAARWSDVTGDQYVASARSIGTGAPQGVNCTVEELLDGGCLAELKAYITETGGAYTAGE
jgi:hypothetical protein